jgi:hypothetical protein
VIYFAVWYVYTFPRPYGYALFKMCSWLQFMYAMPLAYALDQAPIWAQRWTGLRRWAARGVFTVAAFAVAANALSTIHMTRLSLGRDTEHGLIVNLYQMSGNYDYLELADRLRERVKPSESVGLSFVDSIQNEWVSYYLRDYRTSLLSHYVIPADDENLPGIIFRWVTDYYGNSNLDFNYYFHGATDDYYLTWSDRHVNRDIVDRRLPPPLCENDTFRLQRAVDCPAFIYTGRGWYRLEFRHYWDFWWPDRFRWTAEGGEIYMLRGRAGEPYRLSFYGHVGHGLKSESRTAELWHNTKKFDEVTVTGAGRVVSKPFYSSGGVDLLVIKLKERVRPLPRSVRLWNKDIPGDYRRLNLMVADVRVFPPDEPVPEPSTYSLHGDDLLEQSYAFDGLQPNRWAGRSMSMTLKRAPWARGLTLNVFVPGIPSFRFPYTLEATIDGQRHLAVIPRAGPFRTTLPLGPPRADGLVELRVSSSQFFVPDGIDMEMHPVFYSYRVEHVGLVP